MREVEAVGSSSAFGRLLGLEIVQVANGEALLRLAMHDGLRNLHGKLHGGALFSLIDTAMGQASHSLNGGEPNSVTLECKVNYIVQIKNARSNQVIEAEVHQGEKLVAKAQATFSVI